MALENAQAAVAFGRCVDVLFCWLALSLYHDQLHLSIATVTKKRKGDRMNKRLFKVKMLLFGETNQTVADALHITPQRNSAKVNGTNGAEYTQGEIMILKNRWNLTPDEVDQIFFTNEVS
jgi:hypothetical protein